MKRILLSFGIAVVALVQASSPDAGLTCTVSAMETQTGIEAVGQTLPPASEMAAMLADVAAEDALLLSYPVPGNPYAVSVEAPGRVWFTLPEQNLIGRLVVTSTLDYAVTTYLVPTVGSYPYDLVYAGGTIWYTEQQGNKIGRLDPSSGSTIEYSIPTLGSMPTGIDVLPGTPTHVWFAESSGDQLGHFVFTDTLSTELAEYRLPQAYYGIGAELEDVSIDTASKVWFTAPGIGSIGRYASGVYILRALPGGGEPWSLQVAAGGVPIWFTDRAGNRVGAYIHTTISDFLMYSLPFSDSAPSGIALAGGKVWITEELGGRVTRIRPSPVSITSAGSGSGLLGGIDVDVQGHVWFARCEAAAIGEWRPPYVRSVYMPMIVRGN